MRKRFAFAVTAGMVAAGLGLTLPGVAAATDGKKDLRRYEAVCPTWTMRSGSMVDPEGQAPEAWQWGPAAAGSLVLSSSTVKLTKPDGKLGGTEFVAKGLNYIVDGDLTVDYQLLDGASSSAGAVRLFYYESSNPDTFNDAPTKFVAADSSSGTLSITVDGKIGAIGLVYDGSNDADGYVKFSNMKAGSKTFVKFNGAKCPEPTPSASTPTTPATTEPTSAPPSSPGTKVPPPTSTDDAPPPPDSGVSAGGPSLPVTGPALPIIAGLGVLIVAAGVALAVVARRRRTRFTA